MAKRNLGEKIKLTSYDDMFGLDTFSPGTKSRRERIKCRK